VTHPSYEAQVDAYLDGELARPDASDLEAHLSQCEACAEFRDGRIALRAAIRTQVPRLHAPDALWEQVRAALRRAPPRQRFGTSATWRSLAVAALLLVVAAGSWRLGARRGAGDALADQVLAGHIRSLMPGHLTDVLSSDQHTVKPWFNGKLDFSPPVYDLSGRGYTLLGGRIDYLDGRTVAALVYGRRQHLINLFLWPAAHSPNPALPKETTRQGYHMLRWTTADYTCWVVSDLGRAELDEFAQLLRQGDSAALSPAH
jgi:anti-sigma factor RsiW